MGVTPSKNPPSRRGEFVRLTWGGPVMVVYGFPTTDAGIVPMATCDWFTTTGEHQRVAFPVDWLEVTTDPPATP
jgi:uncharacterized protein YodC (DUF2158 family)